MPAGALEICVLMKRVGGRIQARIYLRENRFRHGKICRVCALECDDQISPLLRRGHTTTCLLASTSINASATSWPGLSRAIHASPRGTKNVDARDRPGHDDLA
jgi:hypothetical protein